MATATAPAMAPQFFSIPQCPFFLTPHTSHCCRAMVDGYIVLLHMRPDDLEALKTSLPAAAAAPSPSAAS